MTDENGERQCVALRAVTIKKAGAERERERQKCVCVIVIVKRQRGSKQAVCESRREIIND